MQPLVSFQCTLTCADSPDAVTIGYLSGPSSMPRQEGDSSQVCELIDRATDALYLPLKGGGRRAKRAGWGSTAMIRRIPGPPPDRRSLRSRRSTSPLQGEVLRSTL